MHLLEHEGDDYVQHAMLRIDPEGTEDRRRSNHEQQVLFQDEIRQTLPHGSSVNLSSSPDDARPSPLKMNTTEDRLKAKPNDFGILNMGTCDDLSGQLLPEEFVESGKKKELDYFKSKCVWEVVSTAECRRVAGKGPSAYVGCAPIKETWSTPM